jgi:hypothetical protein
MFESLFDIPLWIAGPILIGLLVLFSIGGLMLVRQGVLPRLHIEHDDAHFSGAVLHSVMIFYGLAVALIAVNVFETYADVSKIVSQEATALAALYRDVSGYPEPVRTQLQTELRDYTEQVINGAWPIQQRGQIPVAGVEHMNRFQATLIGYEPESDGQETLHAETLRGYNTLIQARRMRVDAVVTGLPGVMWIVIILGALISLTTCFFFRVDDARLQGILVTLLAVFIGLVIFVILALDRPFRGDLGVSSEPYKLVYDQLMKP